MNDNFKIQSIDFSYREELILKIQVLFSHEMVSRHFPVIMALEKLRFFVYLLDLFIHLEGV